VEEEGRCTRGDDEEGGRTAAMVDAMTRSLESTESTAQEPTSKYFKLQAKAALDRRRAVQDANGLKRVRHQILRPSPTCQILRPWYKDAVVGHLGAGIYLVHPLHPVRILYLIDLA
jgi:hypothetical protein